MFRTKSTWKDTSEEEEEESDEDSEDSFARPVRKPAPKRSAPKPKPKKHSDTAPTNSTQFSEIRLLLDLFLLKSILTNKISYNVLFYSFFSSTARVLHAFMYVFG